MLGLEKPHQNPLFVQTMRLCKGQQLYLKVLRYHDSGDYQLVRGALWKEPVDAAACAPYTTEQQLVATETDPFPGMQEYGENDNMYFEFFGCQQDLIANAYLTFDSRESWERFKVESAESIRRFLRNVHKGSAYRGFDCQPASGSETRVKILKMPGKQLLEEYSMVRYGHGDYLIPRSSLTPSGDLLYSPEKYYQPAFLHLWELGLKWELEQSWISANIPFYYVEFALQYPKWCPGEIKNWSQYTAKIVQTNQFGNVQRILNQVTWDIDAHTAKHVDTWYDNYRLAFLGRPRVENDVARLKFGCESERLRRLKKAFYEYDNY